MEKKVIVNFVIGSKIKTFNMVRIPKVDEILTFDNKDYIVKNVKENLTLDDGQTIIKYCTCVAEEFVRNMVGVSQFKFIQGQSYDEMEEKLNNFLYENRHKYAILDVSHTMAYIAIQYKLRNEKERYASMAREKSLQES